jgi:uncharacterized membrane protein YdbT with pleckstrin-like domain
MKQLNPKAVWLFFVSFLLRLFFIFIFSGFWLSGFLLEAKKETIMLVCAWSLAVILFFVIFIFIWANLSYRFYKYELTDDGFRKESGVIYKKYVTIPYDRIQNVDINRGIVARILGLSDLKIQTAGLGGTYAAEGRLPGLSKEDAEKLRDELINQIKKSKNQGL